MTRSQVEKFQEIYKKEFGKELSYEDALENALKLVAMIRMIYKPIKNKDLQLFLNNNRYKRNERKI